MSVQADVIRVYPGINIDSSLVQAAKKECQSLDLSGTSDSYKIFEPGENCLKIINDVKKKVRLKSTQRLDAHTAADFAGCKFSQRPCDS